MPKGGRSPKSRQRRGGSQRARRDNSVPKARSRSRPRGKVVESRPAGKRFFSFIASPVVRRLILIVIIVALLYVLWEGILALFGYGLVIIAIALGSLVWVAWRRQFSVVKRKWNWVLGGISLALAAWGILSFFTPGEGILSQATLGGQVGQSITGAPDIIGVLRVAGLVLLGIIFVIPRKLWSAVKSSWRALAELFRPRPRAIPPRPTLLEAIPPGVTPPEAVSPRATSPEAVTIVEAEVRPALTPSPFPWQSQHEPILTPGGWQLPPIDILDQPAEVKLDKDDIDQRARLIEEALASYGVEAKVVQINMGPTVTQFGVEPGWDRKYKEVKERGRDGSYETRSEEVSRTG